MWPRLYYYWFIGRNPTANELPTVPLTASQPYSPPDANQLEKCLYLVCPVMSANVKAFKAFLKERQTGLVQRSKAWVKARQHTIGASEIAVLTGASPFDTPSSLIRKKLHAPDLSNNVACAWGKLFEPFARAYIEWEHNTQVFGNTISLNLAEDHPLYGKVTCSPDGYFQALDGSIVLLEFKCPFKRKIAVNKIPALYRDQVQTGLALSGELVTKGSVCWLLFPDVLPVPAWNEPGTQRRSSTMERYTKPRHPSLGLGASASWRASESSPPTKLLF